MSMNNDDPSHSSKDVRVEEREKEGANSIRDVEAVYPIEMRSANVADPSPVVTVIKIRRPSIEVSNTSPNEEESDGGGEETDKAFKSESDAEVSSQSEKSEVKHGSDVIVKNKKKNKLTKSSPNKSYLKSSSVSVESRSGVKNSVVGTTEGEEERNDESMEHGSFNDEHRILICNEENDGQTSSSCSEDESSDDENLADKHETSGTGSVISNDISMKKPASLSKNGGGSIKSKNSISSSSSVWLMTCEQAQYYSRQFKEMQPVPDGVITGTEAKDFFEKSRLPVDELRSIWMMCDVTRDGCLSMQEFLAAMHLVVLRRNQIPIPSSLPEELKPSFIDEMFLHTMNDSSSTNLNMKPLCISPPNISCDTQSAKSHAMKDNPNMVNPKPIRLQQHTVNLTDDHDMHQATTTTTTSDDYEENSSQSVDQSCRLRNQEFCYEQFWNEFDFISNNSTNQLANANQRKNVISQKRRVGKGNGSSSDNDESSNLDSSESDLPYALKSNTKGAGDFRRKNDSGSSSRASSSSNSSSIVSSDDTFQNQSCNRRELRKRNKKNKRKEEKISSKSSNSSSQNSQSEEDDGFENNSPWPRRAAHTNHRQKITPNSSTIGMKSASLSKESTKGLGGDHVMTDMNNLHPMYTSIVEEEGDDSEILTEEEDILNIVHGHQTLQQKKVRNDEINRLKYHSTKEGITTFPTSVGKNRITNNSFNSTTSHMRSNSLDLKLMMMERPVGGMNRLISGDSSNFQKSRNQSQNFDEIVKNISNFSMSRRDSPVNSRLEVARTTSEACSSSSSIHNNTSEPPPNHPMYEGDDQKSAEIGIPKNTSLKALEKSIQRVKDANSLVARTINQLHQEISDALEDRISLEFQLEQIKAFADD